MNSTFTLALVTGLTVPDTSENGAANLEWTDIKLPKPVFVGDTLWAQSEVLELRESESRPADGRGDDPLARDQPGRRGRGRVPPRLPAATSATRPRSSRAGCARGRRALDGGVNFDQPDELRDIREAVAALCAGFPGDYWRGLEPDAYPNEFVEALTEARLARGARARATTAAPASASPRRR